MTQLQSILCPVGFSDTSRKALRHAAGLARRYGSNLTVLYVEDVLRDAARSEVNRHAPILRTICKQGRKGTLWQIQSGPFRSRDKHTIRQPRL